LQKFIVSTLIRIPTPARRMYTTTPYGPQSPRWAARPFSNVVTKERRWAFLRAENSSRSQGERRDGRSPGSPIITSGRLPSARGPQWLNWPSAPG